MDPVDGNLLVLGSTKKTVAAGRGGETSTVPLRWCLHAIDCRAKEEGEKRKSNKVKNKKKKKKTAQLQLIANDYSDLPVIFSI